MKTAVNCGQKRNNIPTCAIVINNFDQDLFYKRPMISKWPDLAGLVTHNQTGLVVT